MRYSDEQVAKLIERIGRLEPFELEEVERLVGRMEASQESTQTEILDSSKIPQHRNVPPSGSVTNMLR